MPPKGRRTGTTRHASGVIAVTCVALVSAGCAGGDSLSLGRSNTSLAESKSAKVRADIMENLSDLDKAIVYWGQRSSKNPGDLKATLNYVRNLKAAGRKRQALTVLQQASMHHGRDRDFAGEYGRLALSFDQYSLAERLLQAAQNPTETRLENCLCARYGNREAGPVQGRYRALRRGLEACSGTKRSDEQPRHGLCGERTCPGSRDDPAKGRGLGFVAGQGAEKPGARAQPTGQRQGSQTGDGRQYSVAQAEPTDGKRRHKRLENQDRLGPVNTRAHP